MFGKAIVCSDAAAEAARYGFTDVDRPEGVLVLAVASLGEKVVEVTTPPEAKDTKSFEEKKLGVMGLGRKKTDESEHFMWEDDIKVPCGRLVPSQHKDSVLEYNEYAVYDPQQVSIRFLVKVKFEEQDVVYEEASPQWSVFFSNGDSCTGMHVVNGAVGRVFPELMWSLYQEDLLLIQMVWAY
ncbi:Poly [ADP-ribose] polymerase [Heracleum sosnowskyi]|uniref:Poly [ADP-ribose] polymerase n=1 Tax=Heracleum sosnowskyi TaxID=360622 RepID=A0AAD8LZ51_9APIA|nr:Poly [ADP-ribose] polymerase [Heracleum sosnowskyi]